MTVNTSKTVDNRVTKEKDVISVISHNSSTCANLQAFTEKQFPKFFSLSFSSVYQSFNEMAGYDIFKLGFNNVTLILPSECLK